MKELLADGQEYGIYHGDCIPHMMEQMPPQSVQAAIFSPPFPSLFSYTSLPEDIGNSEDLKTEAKIHLRYFYRGLARVLKPGRVAVVHVMQIPGLARNGELGTFDFRGLNIRLGQRAGLIYQYDWLVAKNPQAQAIRTHSHKLLFASLERDRSKSCGAYGDYLIKFIARGENAVPLDAPGITRQNWIDWAECCWDDIRETDTLNVREGRGESDTRHICIARGSLVLTHAGHKPIEEVAVGDLVLTHKGRWQPVTAKRCNGMKPVVKVEAQGVPHLLTTPDHRLWTRRCVGRGGKGWEPGTMSPWNQRGNAMTATPEWVQAEDTLGSYVNLQLPPVEESPYTAEEWWLAGRWLGDGHRDSRGGVHVTCSYRERVGLATKIGKRAGFVHDSGTANQIRIHDADGRIRSLLRGCGSGCDGKRLPGMAFTLDQEHSEALLSGYLSADGHFVEKHQRWTASSVSRALLLGMAMVAQRARGVIASVYAGRSPGTCVIDGRKMKTKQDWILSIPPKNLSGFFADGGAWKKVRRLESASEAEVWDIQVSEDSSFTVEGCIVHNCPLQLGVIDRLVRLYSNPGEIVFSPFAGIGSEGYQALKLNRRFYGCEIKPEYRDAALVNLERAIASRRQAGSLFDFIHDDIPLEDDLQDDPADEPIEADA